MADDDIDNYAEECPRCHEQKALYDDHIPFSRLYKGELVTYRGPGLICSGCNRITITAADLLIHARLKEAEWKRINET